MQQIALSDEKWPYGLRKDGTLWSLGGLQIDDRKWFKLGPADNGFAAMDSEGDLYAYRGSRFELVHDGHGTWDVVDFAVHGDRSRFELVHDGHGPWDVVDFAVHGNTAVIRSHLFDKESLGLQIAGVASLAIYDAETLRGYALDGDRVMVLDSEGNVLRGFYRQPDLGPSGRVAR